MAIAARKKSPPLTDKRHDWLQKATEEAIVQAKRMIGDGGIPPSTPIYRLSDTEWGWMIAAAIFGWINIKAQEATEHGLDVDHAILTMPGDPTPWDRGAVEMTLPKIADLDLPWDKPVGAWSKEQVVQLLWKSHGLIDDAATRRDQGRDDDEIIRLAEGVKQPTIIHDDEIPFDAGATP